MKSKLGLLVVVTAALAAVVAGTFLFAGCSADAGNEGPGPPVGADDPPENLPVPFVATALSIGNADAQSEVNAFLQTHAVAAEALAIVLNPVPTSAYGPESSGCWTYTESFEGCFETDQVCRSGSSYTWTQRWNGPCDGSTLYNDALVVSGISSNDGSSGTFQVFVPNASTVQTTYAWVATAEGSGAWSFYNGPQSAATFAFTMEWSVLEDGSQHLARIVPEVARTRVETNADGNEGTSISELWLRNGWRRKSEIVWFSNGTGSRTVYNETDGSVLVQVTW